MTCDIWRRSDCILITAHLGAWRALSELCAGLFIAGLAGVTPWQAVAVDPKGPSAVAKTTGLISKLQRQARLTAKKTQRRMLLVSTTRKSARAWFQQHAHPQEVGFNHMQKRMGLESTPCKNAWGWNQPHANPHGVGINPMQPIWDAWGWNQPHANPHGVGINPMQNHAK